MYNRRKDGGLADEFIQGVQEFIDFALSNPDYMSGDKIKCPCLKCDNRRFETPAEVTYHLYRKGFTKQYMQWVAQGEPIGSNPSYTGESSLRNSADSMGLPVMEETNNPYRDMIVDAIGYTGGRTEFGSNANNIDVPECNMEEEPNAEAQEFYNLLKDANTPLWDGCKNQTKLSFISQMLNVKSEYNLSQACYNRIMSIVISSLPESQRLPKDFYGAKKMVKKLGLGYEKIDVCMNNCMLFYKDTSGLPTCTVCGHPHYKPKKGGKGRKKDIPFKVLHYLPLTPRLQRLYMSRKTAEHMTWHARTRDSDLVSHPADSEAWKHFDLTHQDFSREPRNVRLGLCTDGFNPFGYSAKP